MKLYGYFRSSAAYRLRIALNLKGLEYEQVAVNLLKGEHKAEAYHKVNAQGFVPALTDGDLTLGQSMAMLEYLEEAYPQVPLLPRDAAGRARVRQMANIVACDIHPLNNLRVLKYIKNTLGASEDQKTAWYHHWIMEGFQAFEALLVQGGAQRFCYGDHPTFADVCLVPQVYNARRFNCSLEAFPRIRRIADHCNRQDAFIRAQPENQPDAI
tara:strand:+ start:1414 stop:2049 length:636 start_codon:yes stop_codon:yes gene_type:complete